MDRAGVTRITGISFGVHWLVMLGLNIWAECNLPEPFAM
jgi:hypothetical protein